MATKPPTRQAEAPPKNKKKTGDFLCQQSRGDFVKISWDTWIAKVLIRTWLLGGELPTFIVLVNQPWLFQWEFSGGKSSTYITGVNELSHKNDERG